MKRYIHDKATQNDRYGAESIFRTRPSNGQLEEIEHEKTFWTGTSEPLLSRHRQLKARNNCEGCWGLGP